MESEEIRQTIHEFYDSPLSLLEIDDGQTHLKMEKPVAGSAPQPMPYPVMQMPMAQPQAPVQATQPARAEAASQGDEAEEQSGYYEVTAPLVGVFYAAASPEDAPYVQPGDHVNEGDVVCLIEAMKMINEIKTQVSGTVKSIVAQNAQAVGFGDVLMQIEAD